MKKERRKHTRVPVHFDVAIIVHRKTVPVKTWDLSMRGLKCSPEKAFQKGDACKIRFTLSKSIKLLIAGKIVRSDRQESAVHFESMTEEGFFHLKKLIQYNTNNPDKIETELVGH